MTFVGIDLAADPQRTGLAIIHDDGSCVVEHVAVGAHDDAIVQSIRTAERAGVDVPLGWPERFVELLGAHAAGTLRAPDSTGPEWRRSLAMRATDVAVHRRTGLTPLSVSTDRIAHPALRWAGIEARLRELGVETSRDGSGVICEVYPAAALRCWSLPHRGYKGTKNASQRAEMVAVLSQRLPWLDWNGHDDLCAADDNALDAVLAALIAREVDLVRCEPPPGELREIARREGWIWLPQQGVPTPRPSGVLSSRPAREDGLMSDAKEKLSTADVDAAGLSDWTQHDETLRARFRTGKFATGLALVNRIGESAEAANHHPDITLTYPAVSVTLSSHDVGGITSRDIDLARTISRHATDLGVDAES